MTHVLTHILAPDPIATWLEHRMSQLAPFGHDQVRLVGLVVVDPSMADPDTSARTTWIGDGTTLREVLDRCRGELDRFDVVAAVTWPGVRPVVSLVIVNP
jgi:hypothetical protein